MLRTFTVLALAAGCAQAALAQEVSFARTNCSKVCFQARPGQQPFTIAMAVDRAVHNNPNLKAALAGVESARGDETTVGLPLNPSFTTLVFNLNKESTNELYQMVQTFEVGHKRRKRRKVATYGVGIAILSYKDQERRILGFVRTAFIRVLQTLSDVEFADQTLRTFDQFTKERTRGDKAAQLRLANERIDLANELDRAILNVELAKHDLGELIAKPEAWGTSDVDGGLTFVQYDLQLPRLLDTAFAHRPDWQAADMAVEQGKAAVDVAKVNRIWNVNFGPTLSHVSGIPNDGVGFVVSTTPQIFNHQQGEIHKQEAELVRSRENRRRTEYAVQREVRRAFDQFRVNRKIVHDYLDQYLENSQTALNGIQSLFRAGKMTVTDYLDALRAYRRIHFGYRQALAEYLNAVNNLDVACGYPVAEVDGALVLKASQRTEASQMPEPIVNPLPLQRQPGVSGTYR
jgi:outer membrane protein TolC